MIISLLSLKGGVGKTTSAVHIATAILKDGHSVAVLDADDETSALSWSQFAQHKSKPLGFEVVKGDRNNLGKQARELEGKGLIVVIDAPPNNRDILTLAGMLASFVVVPVVPTGLDVDRLRNTLAVIGNIEAIRGALNYAVLLTRFTGRKKQARDALKELGVLSMFDARIRQLTVYEESFGNVPTYLDEYAAVWQEIKTALEG
jgi:chromosome partitioning protein